MSAFRKGFIITGDLVYMAVIIIGGAPGVGKSTVLEEALKGVKERPEIVNFADVMLGFLETDDHDAIRKLPLEEQRQVQLRAAEKIASMGKKGILIVDTHYIVKTPAGFLPGLPFEVIKALKPVLLIFVQCPAKELIARRKGDSTRKRDVEGVAELERIFEMNRNFLAAYAAITGAVVKVVDNRSGELKETGKELACALNSVG